MKQLITLSLLCIGMIAQAQSPIGKWVTIDDNTGKQRSVVEISKNADGTLRGTIVQLFRGPNEDQDPLCDKCKGADHNKKVIGLTIIKNMQKDGDKWNDGTIMDPESGSTYDCKLWLEGGELKVRGYLAFFFRTQTWRPYKG